MFQTLLVSFALAGHAARPRQYFREARVRESTAEDAGALYAWCRRLDQIVDDPPAGSSVADTRAALDEWAARLDSLCDGQPRDEMDAALTEAFRRHPTLSRQPFADMIAGVRSDLEEQRRIADYAELEKLPFLNSCIDEAVRLHTMLPGNTVLRKTKREVQLGSHTVATGSVLWLYPNAVHLDEGYFPEPKAFCPMRLLNGNLERKSADFELVTFVRPLTD